jgi:hypothetical protein
MTDRVEWLKANLFLTFGCSVIHLETDSIWEVFRGVSWEGDVEVFALNGNLKTNRCFAFWIDRPHKRDTGKRTAWLVLSTSHITTPSGAVRAYLARTVKTKEDSNRTRNLGDRLGDTSRF